MLISLAIYAKFRLDETPSFHALEVSDPLGQRFRSGPAPVLKALAKFPREIVLAAGAVLAVQVVSITFLTFGFAYATDIRTVHSPAPYASRGNFFQCVSNSVVVLFCSIFGSAGQI